MKAPAAATGMKFKFKMRLEKTVGKALKAEAAKAAKATKAEAIAKNIKKATAKETKKASAKDPKKDNANDGKEDRNEGQEVLDLLIENLDLVKRDPSNTGVSSKAIEHGIEKTFSNLSIDQDQV